MRTDDADATTTNDLSGAEDMLSPTEATDSDELRNDDGDEVVDPPEHWSGVAKVGVTDDEQRQGETLDERLDQEEPDVTASNSDENDADNTDDTAASRHHAQVDDSPEDGDSLYPIVE